MSFLNYSPSQVIFPLKLNNFNQNTHNCERSTIDIDERKSMLDIFIFYSEQFIRTELD